MKRRLIINMKYMAALMTALTAALIISVLAGAPVLAEDADGPQQENGWTFDPYMRVNFIDLQLNKRLALSEGMDNTTLTALELAQNGSDSGEYAGGVLVKGPVAELKAGRVLITDEFSFTENPVGRITINGACEQGVAANALIYIDDQADPAAVIPLTPRSRKSGWDAGSDFTQGVHDLKLTGKHRVSVGLDLQGKSDEQKAAVFLNRIELTEDPGIPTVYVNIDETDVTVEEMNTSPDHSVRCTGSLDIQVPEGYTGDYLTEPAAGFKDLKMEYIRGRGNSTWDSIKKPYKIKLDKKTDLFGMGKNKHYVLLANRYDNSLLRNRTTYWLGRQMGMEYTPQCVPVDVVMNGYYLGSYLLAEDVRLDGNRVDLDEMAETDTDEPEITGGYLLAMEPYPKEDERSVFKTERGVIFYNNTPDFAEYENDAQRDYIRGYIQKTEDAVFGEGFKDADGKSYTDYLDPEAAADYWLVQETAMNGDAYNTSSTYLYKKRSGKLYWGPLWDFDSVAWGNMETPDNMSVDKICNTHMPWFERMLGDPAFVERINERWSDVDALLTEITREGGVLDTFAAETAVSERYDYEKSGFYRSGEEQAYGRDYEHIMTPEEAKQPQTYPEQIEQLRTWITLRQKWINEHRNQMEHPVSTMTFISEGSTVAQVKVLTGFEYYDLPDDPVREGYVFAGWYSLPEGGEKIDEFAEVYEDQTWYAHWTDYASATKGKELLIREKQIWVDKNSGYCRPLYTVLPEDALVKTVVWSSSDESVASFDEEDEIIPHAPGKTVITGTLPGGQSASYDLIVYDPEVTDAVPAEAIEVGKKSVTVRAGQSAGNPISVLPEDKPKNEYYLFFTSEDPDIAEMSMEGCITGISPGTTTIVISEMYTGITTSFEVTVTESSPKLKNTLRVKGRRVTLKAARLKKRAQTIRRRKAVAVTKAKGKVTYRLAGVSKARYKKYFRVAKKTGKITVRRGLKKGRYRVKIRVTAAGKGRYAKGSRTAAVRVRVR